MVWLDVGRWMQIDSMAEALVQMSVLARERLPEDEGVWLIADGITAASASLERTKEELGGSLDERWPGWREFVRLANQQHTEGDDA